jgi:hypothetical protein
MLLAGAAVSAAALFGATSVAHGASYYNIVNVQTGQALQATVSGKVELAPLNKTNLLQQWKRVNTQTVGPFFESAIQNRLAGCLRSDNLNPNVQFAPLKTGSCAGTASDSIKRWSHLSGAQTGAPSVPGYQLVNSQTAEYAIDFNLCFGNCTPVYGASLFAASVMASDPAEFGGSAKWRYKFAATAP